MFGQIGSPLILTLSWFLHPASLWNPGSQLSPTWPHMRTGLCHILQKISFYISLLCVCVCAHACAMAHIKGRGQLVGDYSFFLPFFFWGSNSDHQILWQVSLSTKPSGQPLFKMFHVSSLSRTLLLTVIINPLPAGASTSASKTETVFTRFHIFLRQNCICPQSLEWELLR